MRALIHRAALRIERLFDRVRRDREGRAIEPYLGYAEPDALVVRGRVLSRLTRQTARPDQGTLRNVRQMAALFLTDEVAAVTVTANGATTTSDEEGYFTLRLPRPDLPGWHDIPVMIAGREDTVLCPALVPDPQARFLVISDIDDTVLKTGAYSLWKNLWTSFTGNPLTRRIFPDAVALMQALSDGGRNPIFYVSSSPWNLHGFLEQVFDHAGLVRGPKFLRDLGLSEDQFITGTHGDHKGGAIDTILAATPGLPVILIGDTGQHDAQVYHDAIARHPDRIRAVVLREPGPGPDAHIQAVMEQIRATGTQLHHAPSFTGMEPWAGLA